MRRGERGEADYNLTAALTQELKNFARKISGPCINGQELTYLPIEMINRLKKSLLSTARCIVLCTDT